ncbi:MAG: hypothetical protein LBL43_01500 [Treponema sp.]|nr:hypothetical protein [Treponema sp.]
MVRYPIPPNELFTIEDMAKKPVIADMDVEAVETRLPPNLMPPGERKKNAVPLLSNLSWEYLQAAYKDLFCRKPESRKKADIIKEIADAICFRSLEQFNQWFQSFHPLARMILARIVFEGNIPLEPLEKKYGLSLTEKIKTNSWTAIVVFNRDLRLNFLLVYEYCGRLAAGIPFGLRKILAPWFVPPPEILPENCLADIQEPDPGVFSWNNSAGAAESWPLLCDSLASLQERMSEQERAKIVKGFKKRDLAELRQSSGLPPFGFAGDFAPDSAGLSARFVYMMKNGRIQRPEDGQKAIRGLVDAFFSEDTGYPKAYYYPDRSALEFGILIDHLTKTPGYFLVEDRALPPSRMVFRDILSEIAADGRRFDADKLARRIHLSGAPFFFIDRRIEETLKWKAEALTLDGMRYEQKYYDEFHPEGILRHELLVKPLFKAYCFLFACLGILEITQEEPPLPGVAKGKPCPVSPYDSLKIIKITELGLWCLGLRNKPPKAPERRYEAIADKELLLVTVRGESLERKVYLDKIGRKLGEDRWRISPASFLAGCAHKKDIEDRIERFRALIDPDPAPHWLGLFEKLRSRTGLFDAPEEDYLVFRLPGDRALTEELLADRELAAVVLRAEGRLLIVPAKHEKKFFALLGEHGIARF